MRYIFLFILTTTLICQSLAQQADVLVVNKIKSNGNFPGNVAFLNHASGKVIKTVPVGNEPHEVAISDDKRYAVVTNTGSYREPNNSLSVLDIAAQKEIHRVDLGPLWNPHGIIYSNGLFYFTAEGARAIGAYDPKTNQLVWINGTGQDQTHMLAATKDGKYVVATNRGSGNISIFQLMGANPLFPGAWKETIVAVGSGPEGLDISPDGKQVWVGLRGGVGGVAIVDLANKNTIDSFSTNSKGVARVKFAYNGKYFLATDPQNGNLIIFDASSHQVLKSLSLGKGSEAIFIEPDNKHVLIGVTNEDNVAEVDLETLTVTRRIITGKGPDAMAWIGQ
jgi:DNA-binding beta-propeller fold protein YncE